jgi:hypothetical protein
MWTIGRAFRRAGEDDEMVAVETKIGYRGWWSWSDSGQRMDHVRAQELDSMMFLRLRSLLHSHELTRFGIKLVPTLSKTARRCQCHQRLQTPREV